MTLPESERQKITTIVGDITDVFRKEFNVEIFTIRNADGSLTLIMGDEYVKVSIRHTVQEFEEIGKFIMRQHPGDLALYFGIYWFNELKKLKLVYTKELRKKAIEIIDEYYSDLN